MLKYMKEILTIKILYLQRFCLVKDEVLTLRGNQKEKNKT